MFLSRLIVQLLINIVAFLTVAHFLDSLILSYDLVDLLSLGIVFAIVNMFVKPILKFVFTPLVILTLGFFLIVINAITLYITDILMSAISIPNITTLFLATIIISAVNLVFHFFSRRRS